MSDPIFTLKREAAREPFAFEVEGRDGKVQIPHLSDLDQFELAQLISDARTDLDFVTGFLRWAMSAEDFAALQDARLSRPMLDELWKAYQDFCGLQPGESTASSG